MPFDTLDQRLQQIAKAALGFCKNRYGSNGLREDQSISPQIPWRPTFYLRPTKFMILAVEVDDNLFPEALKGSVLEIVKHPFPIQAFQACSLAAYQTDTKQTKVNTLRKHGFGIITVDDDGNATIQHNCIALAQNISPEELETALSKLTPALKIEFKRAHDTYLINAGQGVQQAGQIVEALVSCMAAQAHKKGIISGAEAKADLADVIDSLYMKNVFRDHRAALGAARDYIKEYRNAASHPQKNAKQAMEKLQKCRTGFLNGIAVASKLRVAFNKLGYKAAIHIT